MSIMPVEAQMMILNQAASNQEQHHIKDMPNQINLFHGEKSEEENKINQEKINESQNTDGKKIDEKNENRNNEKHNREKKKNKSNENKEALDKSLEKGDPVRGHYIDIKL